MVRKKIKMKFDFFTLDKLDSYPLIKDVVIHSIKVNRDKRGILVETLKNDWIDVYNSVKMPFAQNYYSKTPPGEARDIDQWHYHPKKQIDRFVVVSGDIIVALYDWRKNSKTKRKLNLFKMGESNGDNGQYLLLIPQNVLHGFQVNGVKEAIILNFPTTLYDPAEEGRVRFEDVKFNDGSVFSWENVERE